MESSTRLDEIKNLYLEVRPGPVVSPSSAAFIRRPHCLVVVDCQWNVAARQADAVGPDMLNARISRVLHTRWLPVLGGLLVIGTLSGCGDGPVPTATSKATTTPVLAVMPTQTPTHTSAKKPTPTQLPMPTLGSVGAEEIEDDLDALLDGVIEIDAPGVPGPLCVYGSEAFPVIVGRVSGYGTKAFPASSILRAPVVAAGRRQAGRIVALGHDGYFARATLESLDTGRLIKNALHWAAGGGPSGPRIGVVGAAELHSWLKEGGHDVVEASLTPNSLETVDVVAVVMWNQGMPEIEALSAFVDGGGGLVTAVTGWGWAQLHPDLDLINDYTGNRLLTPVGIQWANAWLARTSPGGYAVDGSSPELTHTGTALDAIEAHVAGRHTLTDSEIDQALGSIVLTSSCLPVDDTLLAPRLHALVGGDERNRPWPSAEQPVGKANVVARLASVLFALKQSRTPPESVRAHPRAADFPGPVPDDAPRITRSLIIDTAVPRWHSTGLYAAPGELVTVTVPAEVAKAGGFRVRVGAHSDRIWHQPEWTRMPEISRRFPISTTKTLVANAFGGLIYIEVPSDADLGSVIVEIEGAVAAPLFVLGETDPVAWREEIRHAPAPWAEIVGRTMIVTTVSSEVRALDDPAAVAETWDRVLDLNAELAAWPSTTRSSPERFVVDRQISEGYMHSGYPLMAHLDQQANLVNAEHLRSECNWGFYHEVGHNHQVGDWTFDGAVEVTVNLFTLYVHEFLCGIPVAENERGSAGIPVAENERGSAAFRAAQMARYDFDDPDFEQWKREPFLALVMYEQMQQAFGWDAYQQVFATYRALPDTERPKVTTRSAITGWCASRDRWARTSARSSRRGGYRRRRQHGTQLLICRCGCHPTSHRGVRRFQQRAPPAGPQSPLAPLNWTKSRTFTLRFTLAL